MCVAKNAVLQSISHNFQKLAIQNVVLHKHTINNGLNGCLVPNTWKFSETGAECSYIFLQFSYNFEGFLCHQPVSQQLQLNETLS